MAELPPLPPEYQEQLAELLAAYDQERPGDVAAFRTTQAQGAERIYQYWARAFDHYDHCLIVARRMGSVFHSRCQAEAIKRNDAVFDVLRRLHTLALRISAEIRALLHAGYGDGALARSRTMHELTVIASFIGQHDQETAERFIAHQAYDEYRLLETAHRQSLKEGGAGIESPLLASAQEQYEMLAQQYGPGIHSDYGWAAPTLQPDKPKYAPTFRDIEEAVELGGGRPYYQLSTKSVHISSLGSTFHIVSDDGVATFSLGPSNRRIGETARETLVALLECTFAFLGLSWQHYGAEAPIVEILALTALVTQANESFAAIGDEAI